MHAWEHRPRRRHRRQSLLLGRTSRQDPRTGRRLGPRGRRGTHLAGTIMWLRTPPSAQRPRTAGQSREHGRCRRLVLLSVTGSCLPQVHKRCTGLASTQDYCSTPERLHGLEPQTTAHSTGWSAPQTHQLAVLNLSVRKDVWVRIPPRAQGVSWADASMGCCEAVSADAGWARNVHRMISVDSVVVEFAYLFMPLEPAARRAELGSARHEGRSRAPLIVDRRVTQRRSRVLCIGTSGRCRMSIVRRVRGHPALVKARPEASFCASLAARHAGFPGVRDVVRFRHGTSDPRGRGARGRPFVAR